MARGACCGKMSQSLVLIGLGLSLSFGCTRVPSAAPAPSKTSAAPTEAPTTPITVDVQWHPWPSTVKVQGSLLGDEYSIVGAKVAGRVNSVEVDVGTVVEAGEVLARLDPEEFELRVQQAAALLEQGRAKLGLKPDDPDSKLDPQKAPPVLQERALVLEAKEHYDRAIALYEQNAITAAELQQREAALRVAEARYSAAMNSVEEQIAQLRVRRVELSIAREQQADAAVKAPFAGTIQARQVAPGTFVQVGSAVATLVRIDPLRYHAGVPEREAQRIAVGQSVLIHVAGFANPLQAKITRLSPSLDLASRSLMIEADVPNPGGKIRTGLFAEAEIIVDPNARARVVPAEAVREFAGIEKVRVFEQGELQERRIVTGQRRSGLVEIVSGLETGELVAVTRRPTSTAVAVRKADDGAKSTSTHSSE